MQGCPLSSILFLLIMEVLLIMIREDDAIIGLEIPGPDGDTRDGSTTCVKERSLADDVAVFLHNPKDSIPALKRVIARFGLMSGQKLNLSKSSIVLLGIDADDAEANRTTPTDWWPGMTFASMGLDVEKYHGVTLTTRDGVATQWEIKAQLLTEQVIHDGRLCTPRSFGGREHLARGRYAGKLTHTFKYQVPPQHEFDSILAGIQTQLNKAVIGPTHWLTNELAYQHKDDGGRGHINIRQSMQAIHVYGHTIRQALDPAPRPWKNFIFYYLRRAYGHTLGTGKALLTCNYSFQCIVDLPLGDITEKMRQAFKSYGNLPRLQALQRRTRGGKGKALEQERRYLQQATTPARKHAVVYYALLPNQTALGGITAPPPTAAACKPSSELAAYNKGNHGKHAIHTSTIARAAYSEAGWVPGTLANSYTPATSIVAVRLSSTLGTPVDLSDQGGRRRSHLVEGTREGDTAHLSEF